ncbi:unnamed protein product, partial [Polarella glacialis]
PGAQVQWSFAMLVTAGYIFVVFIGARLMERRPPIQRRVFEYMLVYNSAQVVLNLWLAVSLWSEAWNLGYRTPWGNELDTSERGHSLGMLLWIQYHCRQLDLLDTIFMVLRKKFHRITRLHIYLRLVHMWGWFFVCKFACGGDSYFPAAVNSTCQVLVYLYYAVSIATQQGVPFIRKARVTEVQLFQFVLCAAHAVYIIVRGTLPRALASLNLFVMVSSLALYVDFDGDQPRLGPRQHSGFPDSLDSQPQGERARAAEENGGGARRPPGPRLTFCFDSSGWFYVYHFGVAMWLKEHLMPEGLTTENATSESFPQGLAFSGSSGGALVAGCLGTCIDVRQLFEYVLSQRTFCGWRPIRMMTCVESALEKFLPENAGQSMSGRVRVLLTRISSKMPFVTGEVVDQFTSRLDVKHTLRASCHVPGLNPFPYRHNQRLYYDGLMWSSLLVPWCSAEDSLVVKVSSTSKPLTDIRAPFNPPWWLLFPPTEDVLRGLFWVGYYHAAEWFAEAPSDPQLCRCRARAPEKEDISSKGSDTSLQFDPLASSRLEKHRMARKLLVKQLVPLSHVLPEKDPVTGQNVAELIATYRRAADQTCKLAVLAFALLVLMLGGAGWIIGLVTT